MNQEMGETSNGLESFVVFVERNGYGFQNKEGRMERGCRRFEMVSKRGKGVWKG